MEIEKKGRKEGMEGKRKKGRRKGKKMSALKENSILCLSYILSKIILQVSIYSPFLVYQFLNFASFQKLLKNFP
jgi:hypothetical protein